MSCVSFKKSFVFLKIDCTYPCVKVCFVIDRTLLQKARNTTNPDEENPALSLHWAFTSWQTIFILKEHVVIPEENESFRK